MSDTSSASPQNLEVFVTDAGAASERLQSAESGASGTVMDFYNAPCDPRFRPAGSADAFAQVGKLVSDDTTDERWIAGIRQAFIAADTNTLPDASIAGALSAAGINPTAPGALTLDEPVYQGAVMYSGWSDDPVCTGTGHFLEIEEDLAMPASLRVLAWMRVYSSRFVRSEGVGRGWYSWASTRLEPLGDHVVYHGPDGQVAPFARTGSGGWLRHPGMEAELADAEDGFELRWRWSARWPGMVWTFGRDGRLSQVRDPFGGTTTATHREGRLSALTHEGGRALTFAWDGDHLTEVVSSDGRRVRYRYEQDDLVAVERPSGERRYVTGGDGLVAEVFDADGVRLVRNEYDDEGRILAQESPFGRVAHYHYTAPRTLVVSDDDGGPSTLYRHDTSGRLVEMQLADGRRSTRAFDAAGNPCVVTDFDGSVTERRFDETGNCVWEAVAGGSGLTYRYDTASRLAGTVDESGAEFVLSYEDDSPLPVRVEGPLGFTRSFDLQEGRVAAVEDADGVRVAFEYDGDGQIVAVTDGEEATTHLGYHPSGRIAERVAPTGEVERWEREESGRPVAYVAPGGARTQRALSAAGRVLSVTEPTGADWQFDWGPHGEMSRIVDPSGQETSLSWDALGNRVGADLPGGIGWKFDYDAVGRLIELVDPANEAWKLSWAANGEPGGFSDPTGRGVEVDYDFTGGRVTGRSLGGRQLDILLDSAGRMVGGSADSGGSSCSVSRDELGRMVAMSIDTEPVGTWTYTAAGRIATVARPDGSRWRWSYDRTGRAVRVERPGGITDISYDASGRPVLVSDGSGDVELGYGEDGRVGSVTRGGVTSRYGWDGAGRLLWEQEGDDPPRRYHYDNRGSVVEAVDALGASTLFEYNARGALVTAVDPLGGRWSYERDVCDRIVATTDPLGRRTAIELDPAGRVARVLAADGTAISVAIDPDAMLDAVRAGRDSLVTVDRDLTARRTVVRKGDGAWAAVTVDGLDRVVKEETEAGETSWVYDVERATAKVEVAGLDPGAIELELDGEGQAVRLSPGALGPVTVARDAQGRVVALEHAGLRRTWERDGSGQVVAYTETLDGSTTTTALERDAAGRVVLERTDADERRYRYDAAGQLTGMDAPSGSWSWAYDACGRLVSEEGPDGRREFSYDAAGQLVSESSRHGTRRFVYDPRGRRVRREGFDGATTYAWDEFDRLTGVTVERHGGPADEVAVGLDALGRLVSVSGTPAGDIPGARPGQLGMRNGDGAVFEIDGSPVLESGGAAGGGRVVSADWQGTTGARGVWGGLESSAGPGAGPRVGWLGETELDGVVWLRNRAYDPSTHSFLSRDPLPGLAGMPGTLYPYGYAHNNPLLWLDPLGLSPVTAAAAAQQMQSWQQGHWKEVLITAAAVVGSGILLATGGGALLLPMLIGAAAGGLSTVGGDMLFNHGHIDWGEVVMNTATGAFFGAAAGPLAGRVAGLFVDGGTDATASAVARLAGQSTMEQLPQWGRMAVNVPIGGVFGATQSAADSVGTNQAITWQNEALGFAGGAAPGFIPTKTFSDVMDTNWKDAMDSWASRHPNAWKFSNGIARQVAAAKGEVSFLNTVRVQPPTFLSSSASNLITAYMHSH